MEGDVSSTEVAASPTGIITRHTSAIITGKRQSHRTAKKIKVAESQLKQDGISGSNQIRQKKAVSRHLKSTWTTPSSGGKWAD